MYKTALPLFLTTVVCTAGILLLYLLILILDHLPINRQLIIPVLRSGDILIGLTIYLKTSIDFAIFIGRLMHQYPGWKNRIAIEIGTALGNITGTIAILVIWNFFREVHLLMAAMIIIAALVLLRMAEDGFKNQYLIKFNHFVSPLLNKIVPHSSFDLSKERNFKGLLILSFTVPFILGSDDFAGYLPLFNIVNVFGFATGVFLGHMLLNLALFLSPAKTTTLVKNSTFAFLGSLAFILLALWGFKEALFLLL